MAEFRFTNASARGLSSPQQRSGADGVRAGWNRGAFDDCCGQKCPRSANIAVVLITALAFAWGITSWCEAAQNQLRKGLAPTPAEIQWNSHWSRQHLLGPKPLLPFSFVYDRHASSQLLAGWPVQTEVRQIDETRTGCTRTWVDNATGLQVRCVAVEYSDYPVTEWTVYFKNTGTNNTPILEDVQGLDLTLEREPTSEFLLHGIKGDFPNQSWPGENALTAETG